LVIIHLVIWGIKIFLSPAYLILRFFLSTFDTLIATFANIKPEFMNNTAHTF